jgi:hypothetical protein
MVDAYRGHEPAPHGNTHGRKELTRESEFSEGIVPNRANMPIFKLTLGQILPAVP